MIKPRKLPNGAWLADVRQDGHGSKRYRRTFKTQAEAARFIAFILGETAQGNAWNPAPRDYRRLSDMIDAWYEKHGATLKDGALRYSKLKHLCAFFGDPIARAFTADEYISGRTRRIKEGASYNTVNHDLTYLKAVFNTLIKLGAWKDENPLQNVQKLKFDESEITYLALSEIEALLIACDASRNPSLRLMVELCLSTGCRWGEATGLQAEQVKNERVIFTKTKNTNARAIPISADLQKRLLKGKGKRGPVFTESGYDALTNALERAEITLPKGQRSHVLRHSFAVHFMLNKGNILDLQKILGHKTLIMTLRYAQYHPDYLQDALHKNPLQNLSGRFRDVEPNNVTAIKRA